MVCHNDLATGTWASYVELYTGIYRASGLDLRTSIRITQTVCSVDPRTKGSAKGHNIRSLSNLRTLRNTVTKQFRLLTQAATLMTEIQVP